MRDRADFTRADYTEAAQEIVRNLDRWAAMFDEAAARLAQETPEPVPTPTPEPVPTPTPEPVPTPTPDPVPGSGTWPNEPRGFVPITDQPWNELGSLGWGHMDRAARSDIVTDPTAPHSPPRVLEHVYPQGFTSQGREPAVDWKHLGGADEIFVGFWWKPSKPWHGHATGINKVLFAMDQTNAKNVVLTMRGSPGGPYYLEAFPEGHPAQRLGYLTQNRTRMAVRLGEWHRVELRVSISGGIVQWWVDGTMVGSYQGLDLAPGGFGELQIAPTWGGLGGPSKQQRDFFRYDHVYVSTPG